MLGGMLDLSRMFRRAGDNWVTLQTKLQDQQPKGKPVLSAVRAQLRGSRTAAGTVLLFHTQEPETLQAERNYDFSSWLNFQNSCPTAWLLPLILLPVSIRYAFPSSLLIKQANTKHKKWETFLSWFRQLLSEEATAPWSSSLWPRSSLKHPSLGSPQSSGSQQYKHWWETANLQVTQHRHSQNSFSSISTSLTLQGVWTGLAVNFAPSFQYLSFSGVNPALHVWIYGPRRGGSANRSFSLVFPTV